MAGLGLQNLFGPLRNLGTPAPDQELLMRFLGERDETAMRAAVRVTLRTKLTISAAIGLSAALLGFALALFAPPGTTADGKTVAAAGWDGAIRLCQAGPIDDLKFVHFQPANADTATLKKDYAEDFHAKLKTNDKAVPGLLAFGPDAATFVKFDPAGLRVALPIGYPRPRPGTGVVTDFGIKGDFEITASFEILQEPAVGTADLKLVVVPDERAEPGVWHKPNQNRASINRECSAQNKVGQFRADLTKWDPALPRDKWNNEVFTNIELHTQQRVPTTAKAGRLRLVRNGSTLHFFASDGDQDFTQVHKDDFAPKPLKNVRVLASTGGPNAWFEVHVTDLRIRADAFVKPSEAPMPAPIAPPPDPPQRGGLLVLMIAVLGALFISALGVGAFFILRRRAHALAADNDESAAAAAGPVVASTVSFKCAHCGKVLKAKIDKAGATLKCPKCGQPVQVPDPEEMP